ncbi:DUF6037 family protein [Acinetobacter vivianii]|uniref:DUF6037 family protein n=1 Tax=Acinetobacter vivianii TaxID=1776742 RepID=A0AAJ6P5U9_9GAMM|nr:DUF6037 family protein [Acinetobacter vivianii]WDZ51786.1 DUF6037 family protein [Acinetobacter vivianii]
MMKLTGLIPLFESMKAQKIKRYKFKFQRSKAIFDVIFFTDTTPDYLLLFGARGVNFSFTIPVKKGFLIEVADLAPEVYKKLVRVLGIEYDPNNKFRPIYFFEDFNKSIPSSAHPRNIPEPHEIAVYTNDVEEADKIYFYGWKDNTIDGKQVTEENLEKTKKLLGYETYLVCRSRNISSKWTDKAHLAVKVTKL